MHTSVFLEEAVMALEVKKEGKYIDATFGLGGHSNLINKNGGNVLGIDWDLKHVSDAQKKGLEVVHGNYADIESIARMHSFTPVDGVIFDLGLSMDQLVFGQKGFSFKNYGEPLDMRLGYSDFTAADALNQYSEEVIKEILMKFSEEIYSKEIARAVIINRKKRPIQTVGDFIEIIKNALNKKSVNLESVYSRVFQALRIFINNEFSNIKNGLDGALKILKPDGKIVVITFHSLEDRIVKKFMNSHKKELTAEKINVKKGRQVHHFERSAILRIFRKI